MPSLIDLETGAIDAINILKGISKFSNASVAVIGGLAIWNYFPAGRSTQDVDFMTNIDNAPQGIKEKLLALPNSPFIQHPQVFFYKMPSGPNIQIDITSVWQSSYMPGEVLWGRS